MAFLHLTGVVSAQGFPPVSIGAISNGLNLTSALQVQVLTEVLDIS
jgi:SOS-response transcriptional repressor LexA